MVELPTNPTTCFDNTRVSAYKVCPRSYFIRHVLHWSGQGTVLALVFGQAWHDAQDIVWGQAQNKTLVKNPANLAELAYESFTMTWENHGLKVDMSYDDMERIAPRTPAVAREMLYEYAQARWRMLQASEVFAIERPFAVPLPGVDGVWYIGRLDKGVVYNGQRLILEHKTTTAYAVNGNFRPDYVECWDVSSQVKGYQFGGSLHFGEIDSVWVDAALVHKKVHDAFKFIPIKHGYPILQEWVVSTVGWVSDIIRETAEYEKLGYLKPGMFKKNEESCYGKYGTCPFINICRTVPDPSQLLEPPGFDVVKWEPFSVLGLDRLVKEIKDGTHED